MAEDCWEARMAARAQERKLVRETEEWLGHLQTKTEEWQGAIYHGNGGELVLPVLIIVFEGPEPKSYIMNEFGQWEEVVPRMIEGDE